MCYGHFYSMGESCNSCKVVRSCKRESLNNIKGEKQRQALQAIKNHTLDGLSLNEQKRLLFSFLVNAYRSPVSTYRLTKDFKRYHNINVSDSKIKSLCEAMVLDHTLKMLEDSNATRWVINPHIKPVESCYSL